MLKPIFIYLKESRLWPVYIKLMKILVVEKEIRLAQEICTSLAKKGYTAENLSDEHKALIRVTLHKNDYDLVILGSRHLDIDGTKMCEMMRRAGTSLAIMIISYEREISAKVEALYSGADDYLEMPFSIEELCARVHALLRRPREILPQNICAQDLTINIAERRAYWKNRLIRFTHKEFSILEYLARHPNWVITRDELLSHIWDFDKIGFNNTVDVHIKNLRTKLRAAGCDKCVIIETVRGAGYRFRN